MADWAMPTGRGVAGWLTCISWAYMTGRLRSMWTVMKANCAGSQHRESHNRKHDRSRLEAAAGSTVGVTGACGMTRSADGTLQNMQVTAAAALPGQQHWRERREHEAMPLAQVGRSGPHDERELQLVRHGGGIAHDVAFQGCAHFPTAELHFVSRPGPRRRAQASKGFRTQPNRSRFPRDDPEWSGSATGSITTFTPRGPGACCAPRCGWSALGARGVATADCRRGSRLCQRKQRPTPASRAQGDAPSTPTTVFDRT